MRRTFALFALHAFRVIGFGLTVITGLALSTAVANAQSNNSCGGINVVDKLAAEHPDLHREVLQASAKVTNAGAILWKIEKTGVAASYLFGTMHVSDPRITTFSATTKAALASATTIALEIADLSPQAMGKAMAQRPDLMVYTDGSRLDRKLTQQEFAVARDAMADLGLPAQLAPMVRPWFVYMMMAVPACESARVKSGNLVLDAKLARIGQQRGIPVVGLETAVQQMEIISTIPETDQLELLKFSLAFADQRENMLETLIQLYTRRQIAQVVPLSAALAKLRAIESDGMAGFMETAVVKRNHGMSSKALPLLQNGGAFIAVGTLHLVGEEGLVQLFRKAGYTVTAVE